MKALVKTLVGDRRNVAVVALIVAIEVLLVHLGVARDATVAVPPLVLAGIAWLAIKG